MNIEILYIVLPLMIAVSGVEKSVTYKWWARNRGDRVLAARPQAAIAIEELKKLSVRGFALLVAEEVLLTLGLVAIFLDGCLWPLLAVFCGFSLVHLGHILQTVIARSYVPGLVTSLLLMPYCFIGMANVAQRWSVLYLVVATVIGAAVVGLNIWGMHNLLRKAEF